MKTRYTVETLRSGQPRPYADSEYEYLITIEATDWIKNDGVYRPWVLGGDAEKRIREEEAARAAKTMSGGYTPDQVRKEQRSWALKIVRALCQNFREENDDDGRVGAVAFFYPTLKRLTIDHKAGTIRAFIVSPYTD